MILKPTVLVPADVAQFADDHATKLAKFREGTPNVNNLRIDLDHDLWIHIVGGRGEAGLYTFFGGKGGGAKWNTVISATHCKDIPDIQFRGYDYDSKAIDKHHLSLCVPIDTVKPKWRYVLVGVERWRKARLFGWCTGAEILTTELKEKVKDRPAYYIPQGDPMLRTCWELRPDLPPQPDEIDGYVLQDRDGDYVVEIESTGWETMPNYFKFTKDRSLARVFEYDELFSRQATNPIGIQFIRGFAGGNVIPI